MKTKPVKDGGPRRRTAIMARVKALARQRGVSTLSQRALEAATGIRDHQIRRHFGSHSALMKACGLMPFNRQAGVSDEDLLTAMHEAFTAIGGLVHGRRFELACRYARQAYKSRWRSWTAALHAYQTWLQARHPESPLLPALDAHRPEDGISTPRKGAVMRLGAPLLLPGLQHAPTNEMGVVYLFGALAPALGYTVETIGTAFPDCAAKRRLSGSGEPWARVRLEFEFKSRNFLSHRHDPKRCDVIVCWEHDWLECPLHVVELKSEVARLLKPSPV